MSLRPLLMALALLPHLLNAQTEELKQQRTWTDAQGRQITATLLDISADGILSMRRSDGLIFEIPSNTLSAEDKERVRLFQLESAPQEARMPEKTLPSSEVPKIALPEKHILKDVPMVTQRDNFCVPASAAMIAGFHGTDTSQDEIAQLSSADSISNQGTYPSDMLLAMNKLGYDGTLLYWENETEFFEGILPQIRRTLFEKGPIYISFNPGVFGPEGHGCVIIGYDNYRREIYLHNPWGNEFERSYEQIAFQSRGVALINPPPIAPIADESFIKMIQVCVPHFPGDLNQMHQMLSMGGIQYELVWCSRRDARSDKRFAQDTARREGRKILELSFERNPAVLIPSSTDGILSRYYFVTRPPEGGASFLTREITEEGWQEPVLSTLGQLTRTWTTLIEVPGSDQEIWELPMIELKPID